VSLDLNEPDRPASLNFNSNELRLSSPSASAEGGSSTGHPRTEDPGGRKLVGGGSQMDCGNGQGHSVICSEPTGNRFSNTHGEGFFLSGQSRLGSCSGQLSIPTPTPPYPLCPHPHPIPAISVTIPPHPVHNFPHIGSLTLFTFMKKIVLSQNANFNTIHRYKDACTKCPDLADRIRGPSRSLEMSPFDRVQTTSY